MRTALQVDQTVLQSDPLSCREANRHNNGLHAQNMAQLNILDMSVMEQK